MYHHFMHRDTFSHAARSVIASGGMLICLLVIGSVNAGAATLDQLMQEFGVQQPQEKKEAPDFSLQGIDGEQVKLSDFRGQPLLLHFWATWCVPCRHEMPLLHALERQDGSGFHIVCVNVNRGNPAKVKAFIDEVTPRFHTLLDPTGAVRKRYAVRGLPTTYLIDSDGKISGRMIGERDWSSPVGRAMIRAFTQGEQK